MTRSPLRCRTSIIQSSALVQASSSLSMIRTRRGPRTSTSTKFYFHHVFRGLKVFRLRFLIHTSHIPMYIILAWATFWHAVIKCQGGQSSFIGPCLSSYIEAFFVYCKSLFPMHRSLLTWATFCELS